MTITTAIPVAPPAGAGPQPPAEPPVTLLVVDDHTLFRRGLIALLGQDAGLLVVGEAGDAAEALRLAPQLLPQVILLDNHLPGVRGVDAIPALKEAAPLQPLIERSDHGIDMRRSRRIVDLVAFGIGDAELGHLVEHCLGAADQHGFAIAEIAELDRRAQHDLAAFHLGLQPVHDGVLHQRLDQHRRTGLHRLGERGLEVPQQRAQHDGHDHLEVQLPVQRLARRRRAGRIGQVHGSTPNGWRRHPDRWPACCTPASPPHR